MILYKYMSTERDSFWSNRLLRFTQPSAFNDPFDAIPTYSHLPEYLMPGNSGYDEIAGLFFGLEQESRYDNDHYGILCMSESYDSILMWSHYANNHAGFVVGFDVTHPFFEFDKSWGTRKVTYQKTRVQSTKLGIWDELYNKSDVWAYEKEWRLCKELKKADDVAPKNDNIKLFRIPQEAIKSVYFGIYMPEEKKESIARIAQQWGVECFQMIRKYQTYELMSIRYVDYLSLKRRYDRMLCELELAKIPSRKCDASKTTAEIISDVLLRTGKLLSQTFDFLAISDKKSLSQDEPYLNQGLKEIIDLNCIPKSMAECDTSVSEDCFENCILHIHNNMEQCFYQVYKLFEQLKLSAEGKLPKNEEWLENTVTERLSGAISSYSSAIAWSAVYLDTMYFQPIIQSITFDDAFRELQAGNDGWCGGNKIAKKWYEHKYNTLCKVSELALARYRKTRIEYLCSCVNYPEIEKYLLTYYQYYQGSLPKLSRFPEDYSGMIPQKVREEIGEWVFFYDLVQANGGFIGSGFTTVEERTRMRKRVYTQLVNAGIGKERIQQFMEKALWINEPFIEE